MKKTLSPLLLFMIFIFCSCDNNDLSYSLEEIALSSEYDQFKKEMNIAFTIHSYNPEYDLKAINKELDKYDYDSFSMYNENNFKNIKGGLKYLKHNIDLDNILKVLDVKYRFSRLTSMEYENIKKIYSENKPTLESTSDRVKKVLDRRIENQ